MNISNLKFFTTLFFLVIFFSKAEARPQYAEREKLACIQCHVSPWGAGHRKISGKIYGSRNLEGSANNDSDRFYGDFRMLYLKDFKKRNQSGSLQNGLGLMTAQVSAYVPVLEQKNYTLSGLVNYDAGAFEAGPRETYAIWEFQDAKWYHPTSILLGRFFLPFGLLHDEHRTYTRMQVSAGLREYEVGTVLSFDPLPTLHLDAGYFDGFDSFGGKPGTLDKNQTYGLIGNLRFNPSELPFMLGSSYMYQDTKLAGQANPYAYSGYGVLGLDRLVGNWFQASIASEVVFARHYNDNLNAKYINQFLPPASTGPVFQAYRKEIENKISRGILAEFRYEITPQFILLYKYDHLLFDKNKTGDAFTRQGFGFRYQFNANSNILVKYETENTSIPNFDGKLGTVFDQDNILAVLRIWL